MKTETLLIEIGTEELPPKAIKVLGDAFHKQISEQLSAKEFSFSGSSAFYSPRRLAVMVVGLNSTQPDQTVERSGPSINSAFDNEGNPTKAALGFAQSCRVTIDELEQIESDKGPRLFFKTNVAGESIETVIPHIVNDALLALPIPKPMRWGSGNTEFVRPIHWVVLMYGENIVPCKIKDLPASNITYGHRFHAPEAIFLEHADNYVDRLASAKVLVDFEVRKSRIESLLSEKSEMLDAEWD